jgi:hypothetical protein
MKRRDFLSASMVAASGVIPKLSRAGACPPAVLLSSGGGAVTTTCPNIAPIWFESASTLSWIPVAGGSGYGSSYQNGSTVRNVSPSTSAYPNAQGAEGVSAVMNDWTGGCAYQAGGQYLLPCQGGHNGYYGNEIYSLALRQEIPSWQRIWGPTPDAQITHGDFAYNAAYTGYADGAPRTAHGWLTNLCTATGRIVITFVDACPSGQWTTECYSIDVNNTAAGWTFHGRLWQTLPGSPGSSFLYQNGPGVYDPVANKFYRGAEGAVGGPPANGIVGVDVAAMLAAGQQSTSTGPQVPGSTLYDIAYGGGLGGGWSVVLDDMTPRCWVIGSIENSQVWIMDLTNPAAGFTKKSTVGSPTGFQVGLGAVYHKPSKAILVGGQEIGNNLRKLTISGSSDPRSATYTWSNVAIGGATPGKDPAYQGTFNKFQIINDMGNGLSAIVLATRVDGPTYVIKLPSSGV